VSKKQEKIQTVYVESSVISYFASRPSNDLFVLAKQHMTVMWWERVLPRLDAYISEYVLEEILKGDQGAAKKRGEVSRGFQILGKRPEIERLSKQYLEKAGLPKEAKLDALHIATATVYSLNYLVTWNCTHIANAFIRKKIEIQNKLAGFENPVICTPEELCEI
jgi:predicted nucleic acid-binding protein